MKARLSGAPHVTLKLTACVAPRDSRHLKENFRSLLDLDPAPFAFRPLKRSFNEAEREEFVRQLAAFLDEASERGVRLLSAPEAGEWHLGLKRDWTCHRLGVSLLPDGRFTDCYVAWYCSDFPTWRTLPSLEGLDRFFTRPRPPLRPPAPDASTCSTSATSVPRASRTSGGRRGSPSTTVVSAGW